MITWTWKIQKPCFLEVQNLNRIFFFILWPFEGAFFSCKFEWRKHVFTEKNAGLCMKSGTQRGFENPASEKCTAFVFWNWCFLGKSNPRLKSKGSPHLILDNRGYLRWRLSTYKFSNKNQAAFLQLTHLLYVMYNWNFEGYPLNTTLLGLVIQRPLLHLVDRNVFDSCCWPWKWDVFGLDDKKIPFGETSDEFDWNSITPRSHKLSQ